MGKRKLSRRIPAPHPEAEMARVQFSFKYLDSEHPDFRIADCSSDFLQQLLCKVRDYESYTVDQFTDVNHQEDRMRFYFGESAYPKGFESLAAELQSDHGWELRLCHDARPHTKEAAWRAYGLLVGNVFYVIWLDLKHRLFPDNHPKHATNKIKR